MPRLWRCCVLRQGHKCEATRPARLRREGQRCAPLRGWLGAEVGHGDATGPHRAAAVLHHHPLLTKKPGLPVFFTPRSKVHWTSSLERKLPPCAAELWPLKCPLRASSCHSTPLLHPTRLLKSRTSNTSHPTWVRDAAATIPQRGTIALGDSISPIQ